MGNYNPHAPYVIGNEFAPIREVPYQVDAETERGYVVQIPTTTTVVSGAVWLANTPFSERYETPFMMALYRRGTETATGPVKKVTIPVNGGSILFPTVSLVNASTVSQALATRSDGRSVYFNDNTGGDSGVISMFFDVASVATTLTNKRILNVDFVYTAVGTPPNQLDLSAVLNVNATPGGLGFYGNISTEPSDRALSQLQRVSLGSTNQFVGMLSGIRDNRRFPWTLRELRRFESGATNGLELRFATAGYIDVTDTTGLVKIQELYLYYAALEVTYCEETRILYGGLTGAGGTTAVFGPLLQGDNRVQLHTANTHMVTGAALTPGDYVVTVTYGDMGAADPANEKPTIAALRQLYSLPSVTPVQLARTTAQDQQAITSSDTTVIPMVTLHTSSAVVTGSHAYGRVRGVSVYNATPSFQDVAAAPAPASATSYPQVRYYARRYGDTNQPLTLTGINDPNLPTVSIAVADFDALPEIIDGWKEVTLRFPQPYPTFSSADGNPDWRWTANNLDIANQWQVLVAYRDALNSGLSLWNPTNESYYSPYGTNVFFSGGSLGDSLTGSSGGDALLIFSQDPPAVTGLAAAVQTQSLTVVDPQCSVAPECVPTGIYYNRITWLPVTSLPATGFGYYELQRSDTVDNTWNTIMRATSLAVTGFSDYEARVDVQSSYRIRTTNVLNFYGQWSSTVTSTVTAPGVTGVGGGNSLLIFTSNERQDGSSNLAYVMSWDRSVEESYVFPEADSVQLQQLFRRDFAVAFKPTERGGERFTRTILVQNAAVSSGRVRDGFRSLRDMAWDDVSYVCVRDELGDRWLALITVPSGTIRRNRRLYLAQVGVAEVTETPSIVTLDGS